MSLIEISNPLVMAGKAIFTDVSSCVVAVPSPIMAICQGFAWSSLNNEEGRSRLGIEVTLKSFRAIPTRVDESPRSIQLGHCVEPIEIFTADGFRKHTGGY